MGSSSSTTSFCTPDALFQAGASTGARHYLRVRKWLNLRPEAGMG